MGNRHKRKVVFVVLISRGKIRTAKWSDRVGPPWCRGLSAKRLTAQFIKSPAVAGNVRPESRAFPVLPVSAM
jgi:hypothetical protein